MLEDLNVVESFNNLLEDLSGDRSFAAPPTEARYCDPVELTSRVSRESLPKDTVTIKEVSVRRISKCLRTQV